MQVAKASINKKVLGVGLGLTLLVAIGLVYYLPGMLNKTAQDTGSAQLVMEQAFPDFRLTDIKGVEVTPENLAGKPYILWFTAGWCVPCQIGAERVAALDNRLGGDKFNVVVVFVDKKEPIGALRRWQQKHASGDWFIGFDNASHPLQEMVALQYLDSKYLVDANGILRDVDFQIATNDYLQRISKVISGGGNG
jgi:thiol-disulfide isomerase/thioredoxin